MPRNNNVERGGIYEPTPKGRQRRDSLPPYDEIKLIVDGKTYILSPEALGQYDKEIGITDSMNESLTDYLDDFRSELSRMDPRKNDTHLADVAKSRNIVFRFDKGTNRIRGMTVNTKVQT